jgi:serine phosphatase RsbU (regulator of sigma subunit)
MSLRTRIAITFFFVAVLPLAGMTAVNYLSSEQATRRAAEAEGRALAAEMQQRLWSVTAELNQRIERLGDFPFASLARVEASRDKEKAAEMRALTEKLQAVLGQSASWIEALEYTPEHLPPLGEGRPGAHAIPPLTPPPPRTLWSLRETVAAASELTDEPPAARWVLEQALAAENGEALSLQMQKEAARLRELSGLKPEQALMQLKAIVEVGNALVRTAEKKAARLSKEPSFRLKGDFSCKTKGTRGAGGRLHARLRVKQVMSAVFSPARPRQGDLLFALDADQRLYAADEHRARIERLRESGLSSKSQGSLTLGDWVVVMQPDAGSGLTLGIARPVGEALRGIQRTALRNLALGIGLGFVAMIGILPLSHRMTRDLSALTAGAERLAQGDLSARVPERSRDEIGRLTRTFNRMAAELRLQQERFVEQERLRRELELSRRIQEEMLPHEPLRCAHAEVKGLSIPAHEVGGDFFNYFALGEDSAALLVGDVSGKGVAAALLMANAQATLRARVAVERNLAELASTLDHEIDRATPRTTYVTLFLAVLDQHGSRLRYVNAGHNPPILLRADGSTAPLLTTGRPLGLLPGGPYEEQSVTLAEGDALFLYTDGLIEAENESGQPFGLERLISILVAERASVLDGTLERVEQELRTHRGEREAADDATMVVLRLGAPSTSTTV